MPDHDEVDYDEVDYDDHETHVQAHREARKSLSSLSPEVREILERDAQKLIDGIKGDMENLDKEEYARKLKLTQDWSNDTVDTPAPEGYIWINQSFKMVMCTNCGAVVFNGVGPTNAVLTHDLWHAQIRQMYRALRLRGYV